MARKRFSDGLVDDAQAVFERRCGRKLTRGEAAQMLGELTDFFLLLHKSDLAQRRGAAGIKEKGRAPGKGATDSEHIL